MNPLIENLNHWGDRFLSFAGPMLWQSSALIGLVWALDIVFARKIRASVRYALWLAVLVKLLLPPALALPTGAVWWLFPARPVEKAPAFKHFTVTYDQTPLSTDLDPPVAAMPAPAPKLSVAGWMLLASLTVSAGLLLWLAWRWRQIAKTVQGAATSGEGGALLEDVRRRAGLRSKVRLKMVEGRMSPAVCGLFRPVILLPRTLAENLSAGQLRAVLLHELFHLRRRDIWVNCAQALLQILYWWHPLVWLANARIRRVREEAVDDAVMLALGGEAENYAPALLEVAKLALHRPRMSLGLVGIMESPSALRQRIERLVNFRVPRKAGLTFASLCGIFAFSTVALPMGEAPRMAEPGAAPAATASTAQQTLTVKVNPDVFVHNVKSQAGKALLSSTNDYTDILLELLRSEGVDCNPPHGIAFNTQTGEITTQNAPDKLDVFRRVIEQLDRADGICELPLHENPLRKRVLIEAGIYRMPAADFENLSAGLQFYPSSRGNDAWWSASPDKFKQLVADLESSGLTLIQRPRILTGSGMEAEFYVGNNTNSIEFDCKPYTEEGSIDLTLRGTVIQGVEAGGRSTNYFHIQASAEGRGGIVVRVENFAGDAGNNLVVVIGMEVVTDTSAQFQQRSQQIIKPAAAGAVSPTGTLVEDGKVLYVTGKFDEAEARLKAALAEDPGNQSAVYYLGLVHQAQAARQHPWAAGHMTPGHQKIVGKIDRIWIAQFGPFHDVPLQELVDRLNAAARQYDPDKTGVNLTILSADGGATNVNSISVNLPAMENASLGEVLDAVILGARGHLQYSIMDDGVGFSPDDHAQIETRTFKIDPVALTAGLRQQGFVTTVPTGGAITHALRDLFTKVGVDLQPTNKSVFYDDRRSLLLVRATESDLDTIEHAVQGLVLMAPQIHIKARFIEVPGSATAGVYLGSFNVPKNNPAPGTFPGSAPNVVNPPQTVARTDEAKILKGILNGAQFAAVWHSLESRPDVTMLAEPEVTTLSGRQTQMRATTIYYFVTNFALPTNLADRNGAVISDSAVPLTSKVETGPILDVIPSILADGYTIDLQTSTSLTEFLGYDNPTNSKVVLNATGGKVDSTKILPAFAVREAKAHVRLWDGQTVVIGALPQKKFIGGNETAGKLTLNEDLLVLVTVNLVDAAGNRIHADDEMPFAQNSIPPQDGP